MILLPLLLFLLVSAPIGYIQSLRWEAHRVTCLKEQKENQKLMKSRNCADPYERQLMGAKQEQACKAAEDENRMSIYSCACHKFWYESGIYRLWVRLTENDLMLLAWLIPTILVTVGGIFYLINESRRDTQLQNMFQKAKEQYAPPPSSPLRIQPLKKI